MGMSASWIRRDEMLRKRGLPWSLPRKSIGTTNANNQNALAMAA